MLLPNMRYSDRIGKSQQITFKGYNHNYAAQDGELWDMDNMSSDEYPLLAPRKPRYLVHEMTAPNGLYYHDAACWVDGTTFYVNGVEKGTVLDTPKTFTSLGAYIVILPDKKYYNRLTDEFGSIEETWSGSASFSDGTYAGEAAEGCAIVTSGTAFDFNVGDAVTITGASVESNNKTAIIREISSNKKTLTFYENTWVTGSAQTLTISRTMPDMDFICENENRLWGCQGDEIYASKLGDIFNWNVYDGISTDSYAAMVGSVGDFTACVSFMGYPIFFKEDHIYKVYGDKPSNFQVMGSATLGVETGSSKSLAIAGETLYYLSRAGIVAYSGGVPQVISHPLGPDRYRYAVGGSDGIKYYVSMQGPDEAYDLFVFDTRFGIWHREDDTQALDFIWINDMYMLTSDGSVYMIGNIRDIPNIDPEEVFSMCETGDFVEGDPNKKGTAKLQLRLELERRAHLIIEMQFDSDGIWRKVASLDATKKRSYYLPIIPRRSDHYRIRFTGRGHWRLFSLTREFYSGSELK